jgi:hypothetical protein
MLADAKPEARKNGRHIRWNTWRVFRAENDADACRSFAAAEWHGSDRLLAPKSNCQLRIRRALQK